MASDVIDSFPNVYIVIVTGHWFPPSRYGYVYISRSSARTKTWMLFVSPNLIRPRKVPPIIIIFISFFFVFF
jgi:hypothetical protein